MSHVGEKYKLAGTDAPGIANDHFEIIKRVTEEKIQYDGVLRREYSGGEDIPFKKNWCIEEYWFENLGYTEACSDGRSKAEEEGVVLLESRPGLGEKAVLWHPDGWEPEIKE
ncbi:hypothetical protein GF343_02530 [Candidatus Woesearchaeota archaeon]|nr:hypothetical protein [Candidatus Woesearchaeota archaeon]